MMVEGGGEIDPSISAAQEPDMTQDPRVQKTFGRTGFFCPFATFGVDEMAPGAVAAAAMEEKKRPVLLYLPGARACSPLALLYLGLQPHLSIHTQGWTARG